MEGYTMFGKVTLALDKGTAFTALGLVAAMCACVMLKNGIERFIIGGKEHEKGPRLKGLALIITSLVLLGAGMATMLESEFVIKLLSEQLKVLMAHLNGI
jgi:hypothetical protein